MTWWGGSPSRLWQLRELPQPVKWGTSYADKPTRSADEGAPAVPAESVIRIMCPNLACKRILAVPVHARGKLVLCRTCGTTIRIPAPKDAEDAGPAE